MKVKVRREASQDFAADPYVGFRMRTFAAGTQLSIVGCAAYAIYYALSWGEPHRGALVSMSLVTLLVTLLLQFVPVPRIIASDRWREPFFVGWSACLILVISIGARLDGGAHSALALAFFLPLSFSALSYPTRSMVAVTAMDVTAFLLVAISAGHASASFIFMFASALGTAGWMASRQARIHELHLDERRRGEKEIAHLAYHDALTDLPNRPQLERDLGAAINSGGPVALLGIDLDGFKLVNDSLGHAAGDEILRRVARRLEDAVGGDGLLARHGGDEFAVLVTDLPDGCPDARLAKAREVAERVLHNVRDPLSIEGTEFELDASIGIAVFPDHATNPDDLLRDADTAMYEAKATGHGHVTVYESEVADAHSRLQMSARLRRALASDEIIVHYQPIVEPGTGRVATVEALARWQDPQRGLIPPGEFIPFAEETGMISEIGDRVVDLICDQATRWRAAGLAPAITFNVSPRQLREPDFADRLRARIAAADLDPAGFTVEITESAMVGDPARVEPVLHELAATGVRLAIDDFGAEHSSLGRLRTLPVNMLKVDRSLLDGVPDDRRAAAIVASLLMLCDALQIVSVVEGVETEEQRAFLVGQACPLAQGFGLGRPAPPDATTLLLEQDAIAQEIRAQEAVASSVSHG
jgi:diguanylate cyclase (GGDEF)-like protein